MAKWWRGKRIDGSDYELTKLSKSGVGRRRLVEMIEEFRAPLRPRPGSLRAVRCWQAT